MGKVLYQPERILLRETIARYGNYLQGRILELGSGSYRRYDDLLPGARRLVRLDLAPFPGVSVIGDGRRLPLVSASFDGILCTQVMEHVDQPFVVCKEMVRILKPGGMLLLTVPQTGELHEEPHDYYRFTKYGLLFMAANEDLEVLALIPRGGFFQTISQQLIRYLKERTRFDAAGPLVSILVKLTASSIGKTSRFLDNKDHSPIGRCFSLGWTALFRKKSPG